MSMIQQAPTPQAPRPVFAEFPKSMTHPNARAAVPCPVPGTGRFDAQGQLIPGTAAYTSTPAFMPPVLVHNEDDEAYYKAQGYNPAGSMDEAAFSRMAANPAQPIKPVEEYPKWVGHVLVNSKEEEDRLAAPKVAHAALESLSEAPRKMTKAEALAKARAARKANLAA